MEKRLLNEIYIIKRALNVENEISPNEDNYKLTKTLESTAHDYDYWNAIETVDIKSTSYPQTVMYRSLQTPDNKTIHKSDAFYESTTKIETSTVKPFIPPVNTNSTKRLQVSYNRDLEAAKYNVTIQSTEFGRTFLYFWKIYDIDEVRSYTDNHLESPTFYLSGICNVHLYCTNSLSFIILGHPMQIKFYPRHQATNYAAFELFSNDNFVLKHRFTILNQNNEQGDVTSQILGVNAPRFRISNERLFGGNFTTDGSLTIKVAITLLT